MYGYGLDVTKEEAKISARCEVLLNFMEMERRIDNYNLKIVAPTRYQSSLLGLSPRTVMRM